MAEYVSVKKDPISQKRFWEDKVWVVAGYFDYKKSPDATGDVRRSPSATLDTTTLSHRMQGAGDNPNIAKKKSRQLSLI